MCRVMSMQATLSINKLIARQYLCTRDVCLCVWAAINIRLAFTSLNSEIKFEFEGRYKNAVIAISMALTEVRWSEVLKWYEHSKFRIDCHAKHLACNDAPNGCVVAATDPVNLTRSFIPLKNHALRAWFFSNALLPNELNHASRFE